MLVSSILEKIKGTTLKFSQKSVTVLQILTIYKEARVKITNIQRKKVKSAKKIRPEQY